MVMQNWKKEKRLTAEVAEYAEIFNMVIPDFAGIHILFFIIMFSLRSRRSPR